METLAEGRIALWEGGSLWVFNVQAEAEELSPREMHAHHAFQLTFSLGGAFSIRLENRVITEPFGLVAPDVPHAFAARGLIAHLFIEPEGRAGRSLSNMLQNQQADILSGANGAGHLPDRIKDAFEDSADSMNALREVGIDICDRIAGYTPKAEPDRRVRTMIKWANENLDSALGISEAASQAGLSTSRASHLFVEETGLAFRHYVLWLRLIRAVQTYSLGQSLTDAAHEAGFSDSAHLSRTFKRMFGLPAATLRLS